MKRSFRLSKSQERILNAFADALIPISEKIPERPSDIGIAERVRVALEVSHPNIVWSFKLGLVFLQYGSLFYRLGFRSFTHMDPARQRNLLEWWGRRRSLAVHSFFRVLEVYVHSNYYAAEEVYRHLGYTFRIPDRTPSKDLFGQSVVVSSEEDIETEADVCVIGSGAGGAVIAKELAELGHRVVLLEEGGRFDLKDFKGEAATRSRKAYRDGGISTTIGVPPILLPIGKAIGGTTVINSGTCFRTPEEVFKIWRDSFGLQNFSSENMNRYFERVEATINVMPVPEEQIGGSGRVIARGLERLNLSGSPLNRNVKGCQGSGLCCFGCPTDGKQSVQLNYLPQAVKAGAMIYANCKVTRLRRKNGRINLVEGVFTDGRKTKIKIKPRLVVLAAGSLGTPMVLFRNHLGNSSGQLGRNLTIHPTGKALALFEEKLEGWKGVPQSYYSDFLKKDGIAFEGVFLPPSLGAIGLLLPGKLHKEVMEKYDHIASFGFLIQETARGRVRRLPNDRPLITYNLTQEDLSKIIEGLAWLARIFFAAGAKAVYPSIHCLPELKSEADLDKIYRMKIKRSDLEVSAFHPLGTARMGADPRSSVVDEYGRVYDMENLFITDGSVFPTNLGVNPQVSIMAFASRAAEHIHHIL